MMANEILTPKMERFARQLLVAPNASAAYRVAYEPSPTVKPGTVATAASRLRRDPRIRARFEELTRFVIIEGLRDPEPEEPTDG